MALLATHAYTALAKIDLLIFGQVSWVSGVLAGARLAWVNFCSTHAILHTTHYTLHYR